MKKIDLKTQKYLLFIDTETIGTLNVIESVMPFEIGIKVYNTYEHEIEKEKSYIVRKFFNNKYVMMSTFSATKYPTYTELINNDKRYKNSSVAEISNDLSAIIKKYNIQIMVAHNGDFDKEATARLFNEFGVDNPLKKLDLLDTMELSKIITYSRDYANYCLNNKTILDDLKQSCFITNSGRVKTTAQAIYSYIVQDPYYKESHTALDDIDIEIAIFDESTYRLGNSIVALNVRPTWRDYSKVIEED